MENSSYLVFTNKRKIFTIPSKKMSKKINNSSSSSNLSIDSLEADFNRKTSMSHGHSEDNVDTILVPFYEKDVLLKVPKEHRIKKVNHRDGKSSDRLKLESQNSSYLVNKHKARRTTYLEMFRKQLTPHQKVEKKPIQQHEIRSLSPEVGDTERESIIEDPNMPVSEFYNTESYNEIYYEKILCQELENYLNNSYEDLEYANQRSQSKSPQDMLIENLRSVSDISHVRRHTRRATEPPIDNVRLGGLGPDMERIKPRLERARSLQRYSEKVRMENRLKIYKKSVQVDKDKRCDREPSVTKQRIHGSEHKVSKEDPSASYLMNNKSTQQKNTQILNKLYTKSKCTDEKRTKGNQKGVPSKDRLSGNGRNESKQTPSKDKRTPASESTNQKRAKSSTRNKGINTDKNNDVPDVHINFMVNVNRGVRPSSALKSLEEKHRMYQEQVKAFKMDSNNL